MTQRLWTAMAAAGTSGALLWAAPAWANGAVAADLGNDLLTGPFRTALIAVLGLTILLVGSRFVRAGRRHRWAQTQQRTKASNPLTRVAVHHYPLQSTTGAPPDLPGWLVTGSLNAPRRSWAGPVPGKPTTVKTPVAAGRASEMTL